MKNGPKVGEGEGEMDALTHGEDLSKVRTKYDLKSILYIHF